MNDRAFIYQQRLERQVKQLRAALSGLLGGIPTDQEPVTHDLGPLEVAGYDSFHTTAAVAEACSAYLETKPDGE